MDKMLLKIQSIALKCFKKCLNLNNHVSKSPQKCLNIAK